MQRGSHTCPWPQELRSDSIKWPCFLSPLYIIYYILNYCVWAMFVGEFACAKHEFRKSENNLLDSVIFSPSARCVPGTELRSPDLVVSHVASPASSTSAINGRRLCWDIRSSLTSLWEVSSGRMGFALRGQCWTHFPSPHIPPPPRKAGLHSPCQERAATSC